MIWLTDKPTNRDEHTTFAFRTQPSPFGGGKNDSKWIPYWNLKDTMNQYTMPSVGCFVAKDVPKQTKRREWNMFYSCCGRVADDTKYEPEVWLVWQNLFMWQNFLYDQWSNAVNFYMYFHSRASIWFFEYWHYFHIEKLCHFYCHFHFST